MTCTGIVIMLLDFTLPVSVNVYMASLQSENGSAWHSKLFPSGSKTKQRFSLWFDYTEHFSLKPRCVSESCWIEQTSNWNANKIDPCDFVLRVVWGSSLYEELRWGSGEQGVFVWTDRPYWGWGVWNLGTAGSRRVGMGFCYPGFGRRSRLY